jgi:tRNA-specific 2-thiouridylase
MIEQPSSVVVALSGGLDSSVSAALLKSAGWEVYGLHLLLPATESLAGARKEAVKKAAAFLKIPLQTVDLKESFNQNVINPFVDAYLQGRTPNPCVMCNPLIKFEHLLRFAETNGIRYLATGHYAQLRKKKENSVVELLRGKDTHKDQSYFLQGLNQTFLSRTVFPVGGITKEDAVRKARQTGLPGFTIPESQDICFLPGNDYRLFLEGRRGDAIIRHGNILNTRGEIVGEHKGTYRYTVGQRQGLGIASPRPYYVKELRPEADEVIVGRKEEIFSQTVLATSFNWVEAIPYREKIMAQSQIRYRHSPASGILELLSPDEVKFTFDTPQWAITPGQFICCYDGERVLGGGIIN